MRHLINNAIALLAAVLIPLQAFAQQTVKGVIQDENGAPVAGAFVLIQGTSTGVTSDNNGLFEIKASKGQVLEISCLGMQTQTVTVSGNSVAVHMLTDAEILEDVVVVGYGVTRKRDLAGSVSSIKADEVKAGVITNTADLLRGRAAGVAVRQTSFEPGGGINIRVRGSSSISASNDPLYVVDGIQSNVGNQVSPEDIESIEILKDAAATAIYGARGANGVILITTRQGAAGRFSVDYSYNISAKILRNPWKMMNAEDKINFDMNVWRENGSAGDPPYTQEQQAFKGAGTDWIKQMTRTALTQTHAVNVTGGNDKVRAAASFVNVSDKGLVLNSDFGRTSARVNADFTPTKWLRLGVNAYLAATNRTYFSTGTASSTSNVIYWMFLANPLNTVEGKDVFGRDSRVEKVYYETLYQDYNVSVNNNYVTLYAEADPFPFLKARVQYSTSRENDKYQSYFDRNTSVGASYNGQASSELEDSHYQQLEGLLTFHKKFGVHDVKVIGGASWMKNTYNYTGMGAHDFTTDVFSYNNMGAANQIDWISTAKSEKTNISFFGRAEYVLLDKYIFNASVRFDGASNFGEGSKWGIFPAGSFAWQIGDEPFMEFTKPLFNSIKLRASYGRTGNDGIGTYKSLRTYAFQDIYLGGNSIVKGMFPNNAGNILLRWETTSQLDFGLDAALLDNKLEVNFDWYDKLTTDLLSDVNISMSTVGIQTQKGNNGSIRNRGVEFFAKYHVFDTKDFSWQTTLNLAHNRNTVVSIETPTFYTIRPHGSYQYVEYAVVKEGEPLSTIYGYEWDGILQEGETYAPQPKSKPGHPKFVDLNKDGVITDEDRHSLGHGEPNLVFGWGNTIRWKNFDFTLFFDAAIGGSMLNISRLLLEDNDRLKSCADRWTRSNPSTRVMAGTWKKDGGPQYGSFVNSYYVEDASYLRLSNIEVGYTLPLKDWGVNFIKGARVFVGANRLLTLTKYSGFDPEVSTNGASAVSQGLDFNTYPAYRQVNAGVKVTF